MIKKLTLIIAILAVTNTAFGMDYYYSRSYNPDPLGLNRQSEDLRREQERVDRLLENSSRNSYYNSMYYNTQRTYYPTNYNAPETKSEPYRFGGPM